MLCDWKKPPTFIAQELIEKPGKELAADQRLMHADKKNLAYFQQSF